MTRAVAGAVAVLSFVAGCSDEDTSRAPAPIREEGGGDEQRVSRLGVTADDDEIAFKVTRFAEVGSIPKAYGAAPVRPRPGTKLVRVDLTFRNDGREPTDFLCQVFAGAQGVALIDGKGRKFGPDDSGFEVAGNDEACGNAVQPGLQARGVVPFEVPRSAEIEGVLVWNPSGDSIDGSGSAVLFRR